MLDVLMGLATFGDSRCFTLVRGSILLIRIQIKQFYMNDIAVFVENYVLRPYKKSIRRQELC